MAQNTITITFTPCTPAPASGYTIRYRPVGDVAYRTVLNVFGSPAVIVDNNDPLGTEYEGFLQSDCGGGKLGPEVPWSVGGGGNSGSGSESVSVPPLLGPFVVEVGLLYLIDNITGIDYDGIVFDVTNEIQSGDWFDFEGGNITVDIQTGITGTLEALLNGSVVATTPVDGSDTYVLIGVAIPEPGDEIRIRIVS